MQKMNEITAEQAPEVLKGLISEKILGLGELAVKEFSKAEREAIISELRVYAGAKNENIPNATIQAWLILFSSLNMEVYEIVKRIRMVAVTEKKYGVSEFASFINIDIREYSDMFKFKKREQIAEVIPEGTKYAKPVVDHPLLQKDKYEVIMESDGTTMVKNDDGIDTFYKSEYFKRIFLKT